MLPGAAGRSARSFGRRPRQTACRLVAGLCACVVVWNWLFSDKGALSPYGRPLRSAAGVLICSHRGYGDPATRDAGGFDEAAARARVPDLPAFEALLNAGVGCFDVDSFESSDGVIYVAHPAAAAKRLDELVPQALEAGLGAAENVDAATLTAAGIPRLSEVLALFHSSAGAHVGQLGVTVEPKGRLVASADGVERLVREVRGAADLAETRQVAVQSHSAESDGGEMSDAAAADLAAMRNLKVAVIVDDVEVARKLQEPEAYTRLVPLAAPLRDLGATNPRAARIATLLELCSDEADAVAGPGADASLRARRALLEPYAIVMPSLSSACVRMVRAIAGIGLRVVVWNVDTPDQRAQVRQWAAEGAFVAAISNVPLSDW